MGVLFTNGNKRHLIPSVVALPAQQELGPKEEHSGRPVKATDLPRQFLYLVTLITKERESANLR